MRQTAGILSLFLAASAVAQSMGANVEHHAAGTFDVKMGPLPSEVEPKLGRMSIDKQFHGDLEAASKGEMISMLDQSLGSGGYVAMERVSGKLGGRRGTFVLQHSATMTRGTPHMTISVVPDSGTDELSGLAGTLTIIIEQGKHSYTFDYTLPARP